MKKYGQLCRSYKFNIKELKYHQKSNTKSTFIQLFDYICTNLKLIMEI